MNVVMPPEVRGEPYLCDTESLALAGLPSQYTTLFRGSTGIDELLGLVAAEMPTEQPLHIVSAGCSYGAEVDTVLALAHKYLPGRVAITGVDGNQRALRAAQVARYRTGPLAGMVADYTSQGHDFLKTMQQHGIDVRMHDVAAGGPVLGTEAVRERHQVAWRLGNLASDPVADRPADLVLCNNVVYHYRNNIPMANRIAANLAESTAQHGIVSFGANLVHADMNEWTHKVAPPLFAEHGLVRVTTQTPNLTAFMRVR
jgi:chemotaxis methyl-accepting protein methylase